MNGLCSLVALALTLSGLIHCVPLKKSDVAAEKEEIKRGDYEGPCRRCPSCEVGPCEPCNPCEPKPEPEPEPCNTNNNNNVGRTDNRYAASQNSRVNSNGLSYVG